MNKFVECCCPIFVQIATEYAEKPRIKGKITIYNNLFYVL